MTKHEINSKYFEWMYRLVYSKTYTKRFSYRKLLAYLHSIDFNYIIAMDGNRAEDGIDLRYKFGCEHNIRDPIVASYLDDRPCSVLEMMVALSVRCEEHIMDDPDIGNRTGKWFWNMIVSLGLDSMNDSDFDEEYANEVINRFLNREYEQNGAGGLFTISHCRCDLRNIDIWYQMMWYLNEILR